VATKPSPLIAAVLKEVPSAGSTRPQRIAWLKMIAMAMDSVYGVGDGGPLDIPDFLGGQTPDNPAISGAIAGGQGPLQPARPQLVRTVEPPRFFIDHAGIARTAPSMLQVNPEEIGDEPLFDDRGELGDLGSIQWADGRRGVLGLRLNISATPVAKRA
jgi:hypothetical protein